MNYKILEPEKDGGKWYVIPSYGSGQCWGALSEEEAKEILRFVKNREPRYITNMTPKS
jgi:hypothetical protein